MNRKSPPGRAENEQKWFDSAAKIKTPKYDFYEGINLTISWYINNPKFLNQ